MKISNLKSLRAETELLNYKIKVDKEKLVTEIKLLKYSLIEDALKGIVGLFKRDSNKKKSK